MTNEEVYDMTHEQMRQKIHKLSTILENAEKFERYADEEADHNRLTMKHSIEWRTGSLEEYGNALECDDVEDLSDDVMRAQHKLEDALYALKREIYSHAKRIEDEIEEFTDLITEDEQIANGTHYTQWK